MGAGNVVQIYANWAHLPHAPFRLLVFMGLSSLDADNPPRFFGGFPELVRAYGRDPDNFTHSDRVTVTRSITVLRSVGAISGGIKGAPGKRAEYHLALIPPPRSGQQDVDEHDNTMLTTGQPHVENTTTPDCPQGEGGGGGLEGGTKSSLAPTSLVLLPTIKDGDLDVCPGCRFMRWENLHEAGCHYAGKAWPA